MNATASTNDRLPDGYALGKDQDGDWILIPPAGVTLVSVPGEGLFIGTCDKETAYADAAAYLADLPGECAKSGCKQFENNWCSCSNDCAQVQS